MLILILVFILLYILIRLADVDARMKIFSKKMLNHCATKYTHNNNNSCNQDAHGLILCGDFDSACDIAVLLTIEKNSHGTYEARIVLEVKKVNRKKRWL